MLEGMGWRREPVGRPESAHAEIQERNTMSVKNGNGVGDTSSSGKRKRRRILSPEKKFQIYLEAQNAKVPVGEILRREGLYSTDLVRIRKQVKEGALERLGTRSGAKQKTISRESYDTLKKELEEKERVLAEQAVELAILRKKTNGGSWER